MVRWGRVVIFAFVASTTTLYLHLAPGNTEVTELSTSMARSSLRRAQKVLNRMDKADAALENGIPTLQLAQYPSKQRRRRGSNHAAKIMQLDYSDPYHHEPYDQDMEQREWEAVAAQVRQRLGAPRTRQQAAEEQQATDREWRRAHPYFYHAYGPRVKSAEHDEVIGALPAPAPPHPAPLAAPTAAPPPPAPQAHTARIAPSTPPGVPATVLAPLGDTIRDFDGVRAVRARLPRLGEAPSELTEVGKEVRGSFAVRVFHSAGQPELEVTRMAGGPTGPFVCDYRGYRGLTGDFAGNVVQTGYHAEWADIGGRILTGASIAPTGDPLAEDVVTCRDRLTREVQYFRLEPARILERMPDDSTLA